MALCGVFHLHYNRWPFLAILVKALKQSGVCKEKMVAVFLPPKIIVVTDHQISGNDHYFFGKKQQPFSLHIPQTALMLQLR